MTSRGDLPPSSMGSLDQSVAAAATANDKVNDVASLPIPPPSLHAVILQQLRGRQRSWSCRERNQHDSCVVHQRQVAECTAAAIATPIATAAATTASNAAVVTVVIAVVVAIAVAVIIVLAAVAVAIVVTTANATTIATTTIFSTTAFN
jgi:hypothetical protein